MSSERRTWYRRRTAAGSTSPIAAVITTAPRIGWGRLRSAPGATTSSRAMVAAPTRGVSCVRAPAAMATGVRDALLLTGKPWKAPAARLAAPRAISSWLGSTTSPRRAASDCDSTVVSATVTRAIPNAPLNSSGRSSTRMSGIVSDGSPRGRTPMTWTPRPVRSNAATAAMPSPTATITPGTRGHSRRTPRITTMPASPTASAAPFALPSARPWTKSRTSNRPLVVADRPQPRAATGPDR